MLRKTIVLVLIVLACSSVYGIDPTSFPRAYASSDTADGEPGITQKEDHSGKYDIGCEIEARKKPYWLDDLYGAGSKRAWTLAPAGSIWAPDERVKDTVWVDDLAFHPDSQSDGKTLLKGIKNKGSYDIICDGTEWVRCNAEGYILRTEGAGKYLCENYKWVKLSENYQDEWCYNGDDDDDADGDMNCADEDCEGQCGNEACDFRCEYSTEQSCTDGHDNDGDGLDLENGMTDCNDLDDCSALDVCDPDKKVNPETSEWVCDGDNEGEDIFHAEVDGDYKEEAAPNACCGDDETDLGKIFIDDSKNRGYFCYNQGGWIWRDAAQASQPTDGTETTAADRNAWTIKTVKRNGVEFDVVSNIASWLVCDTKTGITGMEYKNAPPGTTDFARLPWSTWNAKTHLVDEYQLLPSFDVQPGDLGTKPLVRENNEAVNSKSAGGKTETVAEDSFAGFAIKENIIETHAGTAQQAQAAVPNPETIEPENYLFAQRFACHTADDRGLWSECCGYDLSECINSYPKARRAGTPLQSIKEFHNPADRDLDTANAVLRILTTRLESGDFLDLAEGRMKAPEDVYDSHVIQIKNADVPIYDWTDYKYLEFYVYLATNFELDIRLGTFEGDQVSNPADSTWYFNTPVVNYVQNGAQLQKWLHVMIPLASLSGKRIDTIMFYVDNARAYNSVTYVYVEAENKKYQNAIGIDKISLIPKDFDRIVCTGGESPTWISDLDEDKDSIGELACEETPSFGWTGTACCGDDTTPSQEEIWADAEAGCWMGNTIRPDTPFGVIKYVSGTSETYQICFSKDCIYPYDGKRINGDDPYYSLEFAYLETPIKDPKASAIISVPADGEGPEHAVLKASNISRSVIFHNKEFHACRPADYVQRGAQGGPGSGDVIADIAGYCQTLGDPDGVSFFCSANNEWSDEPVDEANPSANPASSRDSLKDAPVGVNYITNGDFDYEVPE
ncbi:MAG: hypothetical protein ABH879_10145 [archaeon]